jgi:hypothetical protein
MSSEATEKPACEVCATDDTHYGCACTIALVSSLGLLFPAEMARLDEIVLGDG